MITFTAATLIKSADVNQNFTDLTTGDGDTTANSLKTFRSEALFDFVLSGGIWTGDSYAVNKNASMSALVVVVNGRRISISAVVARVFTASKDTYIDVLDNLDGTGTLVYTEVANNAASPALAANSIRIGIIVTGATTIASVASINQGQETKLVPAVSSVPLIVTDSLGNLICGRDPLRKLLGYSRITTPFTTVTVGSYVDITGLQAAFIAPTGRKIKVRFAPTMKTTAAAAQTMTGAIRESSTVIAQDVINEPVSGFNQETYAEQILTPSAGAHTYKASAVQNAGAGTLTVQAGTFASITDYGALEMFIELE